MTIDKKVLRQLLLGAAGCVFLYWLLHETERLSAFLSGFWGVISPFAVGASMAFILNVPMRPIEKWFKGVKQPGARRALAILTTFLVVILVLTGVIWLLVPQIVDTVETLIDLLPSFFERCRTIAVNFLNDNPELLQWLNDNTDFEAINWSEMIQKAISWLSGGMTAVLDSLFTVVISLSTGIFNAVLSIVFGLYCLSRKEILARQGRRILYSILPEKASDETIRILRMTNATFSNFISGQCLEAVILGSMFAVSMTIFRMPFMPLVSVIIAVTALVPIVGAFVGCILGAFFILVQDPMLAVWFVVMFLALQQIEGNLIYPKVVGSSIGLPGMWVLLAVAVGGDLMGVAGMLVMIPLASVLYALGREFTNKQLATRGIDPEKLQDQPQDIKSKFKEKRQKKREARHMLKLEKLAEKLHPDKKE